MTVCVAAICGTGAAFGASDRMLTAGDVKFEPTQGKIWYLTNSIAAMIAGDSAIQTEILQGVYKDLMARIKAEPGNWWMVKDVAELYSHYYRELRTKRTERAILSPLGLNANTFISRQREMADSLVKYVATELINFQAPDVATIFVGADPEGVHIYVTQNADIECFDNVGFAAIGVGRWHASSQFMFAQHDKLKPFPETLLLTYAAKKRAEVSPGVGQGTDMFTVGPAVGSLTAIVPDVVNELEKMYQATRSREKRASSKANREVNKYVENLIRAATAQEQEVKPKDGAGNPPSDDKENVRDGAKEGQPEN